VRVAVLWTGLSGYMNACLRELASRPGVELFVAHAEIKDGAPFDEAMFDWIKNRVIWKDKGDYERLSSQLTAFNPQVIVVAGWHVPLYRKILKTMGGRCLRLMTMDNRWSGSLKQRLGTLISSRYVLPLTDAAWVPGFHQAVFASKLGFASRNILQGSLSCEQDQFSAVYKKRVRKTTPLPRAFIFVGRLVPQKGIDVLASAYQSYFQSSADPWPLVVCGTGPSSPLLENQPGIVVKGFVQPTDLPNEMAKAGCLILPSNFEPWALVVNEAAAAGLLIVATDLVGAVPHLVQNYYNGFTVGANKPSELIGAMKRVSDLSPESRERMSRASNELSRQYTPARWVNTLLEFARDRVVGELP
jgi:glycosyltransferase involved in cell wall biosynthesis